MPRPENGNSKAAGQVRKLTDRFMLVSQRLSDFPWHESHFVLYI